MKFYICEYCGNITAKLTDSGVPLICCGEEMAAMKTGTAEASVEKHIPVITRTGHLLHIAVGSAPHPMEEKHFIRWIVLETTEGFQVFFQQPDQSPEITVGLAPGEILVAAYADCNLHGLWKGEIML